MTYGDFLVSLTKLIQIGFTFIDNHNRVYWVYLLKEKYEVHDVYINFLLMIQTQF